MDSQLDGMMYVNGYHSSLCVLFMDLSTNDTCMAPIQIYYIFMDLSTNDKCMAPIQIYYIFMDLSTNDT